MFEVSNQLNFTTYLVGWIRPIIEVTWTCVRVIRLFKTGGASQHMKSKQTNQVQQDLGRKAKHWCPHLTRLN